MYGLPKIHQPNVPLRPILSMCCSVKHELAKWLLELLDPVQKFHSACCINDSFLFTSVIRQLPRCMDTEFLISFDISSLFTNIPLDETISVCADYLYCCHSRPPSFPEHIFIELMEFATNSVSFCFNDTMYQVDGISMVSPLGHLLTNVFMGFLELQLFDKVHKPYCYIRYVD